MINNKEDLHGLQTTKFRLNTIIFLNPKVNFATGTYLNKEPCLNHFQVWPKLRKESSKRVLNTSWVREAMFLWMKTTSCLQTGWWWFVLNWYPYFKCASSQIININERKIHFRRGFVAPQASITWCLSCPPKGEIISLWNSVLLIQDVA